MGGGREGGKRVKPGEKSTGGSWSHTNFSLAASPPGERAKKAVVPPLTRQALFHSWVTAQHTHLHTHTWPFSGGTLGAAELDQFKATQSSS